MSKILLVDDDNDLADLLKMKLVAEGHDVVTTHTGEGAFELAKQMKPDIALLDIMLPDRKSTRLNSSHIQKSRMPSSA